MIKEVNIENKEIYNRIIKFVNSKQNIDVKQTLEWGIFREEEKILLYSEDEEKNILMYVNAFVVYDEEVEETVVYIPRGPVYNERIYSLEECLNLLCNYFKTQNYRYIRTNPRVKDINLKSLSNAKILLIPKNEYVRQKESYREAILELEGKNENELLDSYHYKTRYNIRKSIRYGVSTEVEEEIDIDEFYKLYIVTSERHGFIPHSKEYFQKLVKTLKDKLVFGITKYEDKILAMSINVKQANEIFYLYGVSANEERNKFACYNLHHTMIMYSLNNGFKYYNFGGVFSDDKDIENKDYGLLVFKSRFCTKGFTEYNTDILIDMEE